MKYLGLFSDRRRTGQPAAAATTTITTIEEYNGRKATHKLSLSDGTYSTESLSTASGTIRASVGAALLPEGYPHSVTPDYLSESPLPRWAALQLPHQLGC